MSEGLFDVSADESTKAAIMLMLRFITLRWLFVWRRACAPPRPGDEIISFVVAHAVASPRHRFARVAPVCLLADMRRFSKLAFSISDKAVGFS